MGENAALEDLASLREELLVLAEAEPFELPNNSLIPSLYLASCKDADFFWKSHFPIRTITTDDITLSDTESDDESYDEARDDRGSSTASDDSSHSDGDDSDHSEGDSQTLTQALSNYKCACKPKRCGVVVSPSMSELLPQFRRLSHREKQLYVSGLMAAYSPVSKPPVTLRRRRDSEDDAQRQFPKYLLFGSRICRKYLYRAFGERRVRNIIKSIRHEKCFIQEWRMKGRKAPATSLTSLVINWLEQFAATHGLPVPHARGAHKDKTAIQLPMSFQRMRVFDEYRKDCVTHKLPPASKHYFLSIWRAHVPWVKVATPRTDYCDTCVGGNWESAQRVKNLSKMQIS
jgi:hypothetical protein